MTPASSEDAVDNQAYVLCYRRRLPTGPLSDDGFRWGGIVPTTEPLPDEPEDYKKTLAAAAVS